MRGDWEDSSGQRVPPPNPTSHVYCWTELGKATALTQQIGFALAAVFATSLTWMLVQSFAKVALTLFFGIHFEELVSAELATAVSFPLFALTLFGALSFIGERDWQGLSLIMLFAIGSGLLCCATVAAVRRNWQARRGPPEIRK